MSSDQVDRALRTPATSVQYGLALGAPLLLFGIALAAVGQPVAVGAGVVLVTAAAYLCFRIATSSVSITGHGVHVRNLRTVVVPFDQLREASVVRDASLGRMDVFVLRRRDGRRVLTFLGARHGGAKAAELDAFATHVRVRLRQAVSD